MSEALRLGLNYGFLVLIIMDVYITYIRRPSWREAWEFVFGICWAIFTFLIAVGAYIAGEKILCALYSFYCVFFTYKWWHDDQNKRKRKKLLDRAAGRVKDIGGRLKVVQPNET